MGAWGMGSMENEQKETSAMVLSVSLQNIVELD